MNTSLENKIKQVMEQPETLGVCSPGSIIYGTDCFSVALYVSGLTSYLASYEGSDKILACLLEGKSSHVLEQREIGDLLVFEHTRCPAMWDEHYATYDSLTQAALRLAHAAVYIGNDCVFQQDHVDGRVGERTLNDVVKYYRDVTIVNVYSPADLKDVEQALSA